MITADVRFFSSLMNDLVVRSARATVSYASPASRPLLRHLQETLEVPPGVDGSFVAPPLFEALFSWETSALALKDVSFLDRTLVEAMGAPPQELAEYAFPANQRPYVHQIRAWEHLHASPARSVVIRTGTASGKTECYLVPILNDLLREADAAPGGGPLIGVRALFLYPLNALINSQRDRLLAWSAGLGSRIRFCLYNGLTPDGVREDEQRKAGNQVLSRKLLRSEPPPILVTNVTMLEYMLVRGEDRPIREHSRGRLRWVVLDEAHTYVGSAAAEIALLLRRVMHAFDVTPENVRFVATSATIGGDDADERLQRFLADLAGVDVERVHVVGGRRVAPELPARLAEARDALPEISTLEALEPARRFEAMAAVPAVRALRRAFCERAPLGLDDVARILELPEGPKAQETALRVLDLASAARSTEGDDLLPLRGHFFVRTSPGLWACLDRRCSGRKGTRLDDDSWGFGKVFLGHRTRCDACSSLVYEVLLCTTCGVPALAAECRDDAVLPSTWGSAGDTRDLDVEIEGDEVEDGDEASGDARELVVARASEYTCGPISIDPATAKSNGDVVIHLAKRRKGDLRLQCPHCGQVESAERDTFRPVRLGAPFYLSVGIPTILDRLAPENRERPAEGRRLLTFSDSRQGSARFAAKMQLESERNFARTFVYHKLWSKVEQVDETEKKSSKTRFATSRKLSRLDRVSPMYSSGTKRSSRPCGGKKLGRVRS